MLQSRKKGLVLQAVVLSNRPAAPAKGGNNQAHKLAKWNRKKPTPLKCVTSLRVKSGPIFLIGCGSLANRGKPKFKRLKRKESSSSIKSRNATLHLCHFIYVYCLQFLNTGIFDHIRGTIFYKKNYCKTGIFLEQLNHWNLDFQKQVNFRIH